MTDINHALFSRVRPKKKLETIDSLTQSELLSISTGTIERIVKEAGRKAKNARQWELFLSMDNRVGNSWDSNIESVYLHSKRIYVNLYCQYGNTDGNFYVPWSEFIKSGDYRGTIKSTDRFGNDKYSYYFYYPEHKAGVIRAICREYVKTKYREHFQG